jgi:hypothetical protein
VHYVIRTIHTIKFSSEWLVKAHTADGRTWKKDYLERSFQSAESDAIKLIENSGRTTESRKKMQKLRSSFRGRHEKVVASRNHVRRLYVVVRGNSMVPSLLTNNKCSLVPVSC